MRIKVKLVNRFREYGQNKLSKNNYLEVEGNYTVKDLLKYLNIPQEVNKLVLVNGRDVDEDKELADGDKVVIYNMVAGG